MALAQVEFFSKALSRSVSFRIILPNDVQWGVDYHHDRPAKLLILLHGYNGFEGDWLYNSNVYDVASRYNVAVAMPNGENSFYTDGKATGRKYATFIGEELPEYIEKTFHISAAPENTFVGGLSMGGYGAIHSALAFPNRFGKCFALSAALIDGAIPEMKPGDDNGMANYEYYTLMFDTPENMEHSDTNLRELVNRIQEKGEKMPEIYMAIGTEDFLLVPNREFHAFLQEKKVEHSYHESTGVHDFVFWNKYLEPAVKWAVDNEETEGL